MVGRLRLHDLITADRLETFRADFTRLASGDVNTIETVLHFATTMTWNGMHPVVELITTTYQTGVKLNRQHFAFVDQRPAGGGNAPRDYGILNRSIQLQGN